MNKRSHVSCSSSWRTWSTRTRSSTCRPFKVTPRYASCDANTDAALTDHKLSSGLAALADSYPDRILERLLKDFQRGPSLPSSNKERSLETRLKVGEVLMRASRAMGEHRVLVLVHSWVTGSRLEINVHVDTERKGPVFGGIWFIC